MANTIFRIAEDCGRIIYGGNIPDAGKISLFELKNAVCQVVNNLLKTDYVQTNEAVRDMIPDGTVLGLYEAIPVTKWRGKSAAALPVKPVKLRRDLGIYSVFDTNNPDNEYIPISIGQFGLLRSQPLISNLLGQAGYEPFGMQIVFSKDISSGDINNPTLVSMRLIILDISQYGDFDPLPILPEMEWLVKKEVVAMYSAEMPADKVIDPGRKEQKGIPLTKQTQT